MRRALLPVLALTGVVIGHTLAYGIAFHDGTRRASLLRDTGHAYWQAAVAAALIAGVLAAGSHARLSLRRVEGLSLPRAGLCLAAGQVAMFTMMEASERVAIDQPLTTLFDHHVFVIGIVMQVVVAAVLVQALRLLGRAVVAIVERSRVRRAGPAASPALLAAVATEPLRDARSAGPCGSRAPPLAA